MRILTVIGARLQFIKASPVSKAIREAGHQEILVHTGQHYDYGMSQVFFEELNLPEPDVNLGVGSGQHGWQTGQILIGIEKVLLKEKPDWVLVYGDTNSTLAGALAAIKLHIPLAHVEAGLCSFNREMPEEHNRVLTDHCADLLFCPTQTAVDNLKNEGIVKGVYLVGDPMHDAVLEYGEIAGLHSTILKDLGLETRGYLLLTVHRQENTENPENLRSILGAMSEVEELVVFPAHPRTKAKIGELEIKLSPNVFPIEPVGYLDMLRLEQSARMILTDSGGVQKEAYWLGVPCVTLRDETEWVETVQVSWNVLVGAKREQIVSAVHMFRPSIDHPQFYSSGNASQQILEKLQESLPYE